MKIIRRIIFIIALLVFIGSAGYLGLHYFEGQQTENAFRQLTVDGGHDLAALHEQNPDIVGWIKIDDTRVDYPVMWTPDDPEFYLRRNFQKEDSVAGTPFLDAASTMPGSSNWLIYGHNMADGSKFGSLKFMDSQEKYDANPYFWILTPRGNYRYKIFSMFRTPATSDVYLVYSWHGSSFLAWEKMWRESSDVKTDVPLTAQDRTVCLTTCTSDENVRFVVFGKCVSSKKPVHTRTIADGPSLQDSSPSLPE